MTPESSGLRWSLCELRSRGYTRSNAGHFEAVRVNWSAQLSWKRNGYLLLSFPHAENPKRSSGLCNPRLACVRQGEISAAGTGPRDAGGGQVGGEDPAQDVSGRKSGAAFHDLVPRRISQ